VWLRAQRVAERKETVEAARRKPRSRKRWRQVPRRRPHGGISAKMPRYSTLMSPVLIARAPFWRVV